MAEITVLPVSSSPTIELDMETLNLEEIFDYLDQKTKEKQLERNIRARSPTRSETPRLLDPEHPLLLRFQKALRTHLEGQISVLSADVFELEAGVKICNEERERKGIKTYEAQQVVSRQQVLLEQSATELSKQSGNGEHEAVQLEETEKKYKEESSKLAQVTQQEIQLRNEVEVTNNLLRQFSKWENDVESELKMNQRISEKTRKDKLKLATEKRKQDMQIHRLQSEVWRLDSELETMVMQLRIKEEEREKLAQAVATSNTDLQANESELRCLMYGWQSVINAIQQRDKEVNNRRNELTRVNEQIQSTIAEIESIKKFAAKEMIKNESLTMFKMRVEIDLKNCNNQLNTENNKKNNIEKSISKMQIIIDQIDVDIRKIALENAAKLRALSVLIREFDSLMTKKNDIEQLIIHQLQDQITNDKASIYMAKLVGQAKEVNWRKETTFADLENNNAQVLMEIESQKYVNESATRRKTELELDLNKIDKEVSQYMEVIKHCISTTGKQLRNIEVLQKKLDETIQRSGEVSISPYERRIKQLELSIDDVVENSTELQKFWMSEQGHVIHLYNQRQIQLKDTNILKKQILILDQKNLKIADDIDDFNKKVATINRGILFLQNKLEQFHKMLDKKKHSKTDLDTENFTKSRDFEIKLGELELETINMENTLTEHEEEKNSLANELIEKNREVLEWEKKLKMILETKKTIIDEKSDSGETGKMRLEIHKMEVRYSHLKKASDQMIADLEHCVSRRDGIVTNALAKEKRCKGDSNDTRFHYKKRLDQVKNKTRQLNNQLDALNKKIGERSVDVEKITVEAAILKEEVAELEKNVADLREQLEQKETDKLLKFEILLCKQRDIKIYSELTKSRKPFSVYKTEKSQSEEYTKQKDINDKILSTLDKLLTDFPIHVHSLNRICNTLKVPILYL